MRNLEYFRDSFEAGIMGAGFGAAFSLAFHPEHFLPITAGTAVVGFILPLIGKAVTKEKTTEEVNE